MVVIVVAAFVRSGAGDWEMCSSSNRSSPCSVELELSRTPASSPCCCCCSWYRSGIRPP
eukprot:COSAG06_NODE_58665_length_276_cov_0.875706_1_plen_58_part_01